MIYFAQKGCSELSDLFRIWDICDNISLVAQGRGTVALEH